MTNDEPCMCGTPFTCMTDKHAYWAEIGPECGITSDEIPGFGFLYCERIPGHEGQHAEREDGHVWGATT